MHILDNMVITDFNVELEIKMIMAFKQEHQMIVFGIEEVLDEETIDYIPSHIFKHMDTGEVLDISDRIIDSTNHNFFNHSFYNEEIINWFSIKDTKELEIIISDSWLSYVCYIVDKDKSVEDYETKFYVYEHFTDDRVNGDFRGMHISPRIDDDYDRIIKILRQLEAVSEGD